VAPGWRWVAIQASEDDKAQVVELTSRARDFYVDARVWRNTQEVEFSADGRWLLVRHGDESEYMYDLATNSSLIQQTRVNLPPGTYSRTFSANGRYVLFARYVNVYQEGVDRGRTVGVLAQLDAVNDSSTRREISGFATGIGQAAFSTDGSWLAVAGDSRFPDRSKDDNAVKVFSTRDPQVRDVTLEGHEFAVGLQFSPDGRWLLTASSDMTLRGSRTQSRLWRLRTEGVVATPVLLPDVVTYLHAVQFSPDGRFLVTISGAGPTGRLWRLAEQVSLVTTLTVPKPRNNWYYRIVFSNNSDKVVISGWDDPTPLFWRPSSDRISAAGTAILNGDREIQQMHFTESGEHLVILNSGKTTTGVSGSSGSHITVVDFRRFPQYGSIYAAVDSDDEVRAVSDRLNFGLLLTSGASLRAWSVDVARMLRQAEGAVGRNLTLDEWVRSELLGSYRPTFSRYPVDAASLRALPTLVGRFRAESPRMADALADRVVAWANQLDEADVCNDVAWAFVLQRNGRAAAQAIECALRHFPLNDEYRDTRGAAFALLGRRNEAIADFTFYVDAQRDNSKQAESVARRLKWIDALRMRVDPFVNGIE
jgi:WD40 repeat protein